MAAIFVEGFDKYGGVNTNVANVQSLLTAGEWTTVAASGANIVGPLSATGQALQLDFTSSSTLVTKTLSASYSRLIGGFRFNVSVMTAGANAGIQFRDGATAQCSLVVNASTGLISLRNGGIAGTALATSGTAVTQGSTHYLEWDITFGNTAAYQVWLDGVSLFSNTGDTTTTANNTASSFALISTSSGHTIIFDDLYLFDSTGSTNNAVLLTSPRIETTFPTSDSAQQFAFGAGILGSSVVRTVTLGTVAAGSLALRRFIPAAAGTLNSVSFAALVSSGAINLRGVVYADSSGAAGTLLSSGTTVVGITSGNTVTLPLTTPQSLSAGVPYWIGLMNDLILNNAIPVQDAGLSGYRVAATFASGAPGTAPAMTAGQPSYAFWGNLTGVAVNFDEVNNQPPDGALSYVFDATVGHEDKYNFGALSVTPTSVYAVAVKGYIARSDSGAKTISLRAGSGAGSLAGQTPATSFGWLTSVFETDPGTGAAWTGPNLNATTSGVRVDS